MDMPSNTLEGRGKSVKVEPLNIQREGGRGIRKEEEMKNEREKEREREGHIQEMSNTQRERKVRQRMEEGNKICLSTHS